MGMLDGEVTVLQGDIARLIKDAAAVEAPVGIVLSDAERDVLRKVLERDHTARIVHGGLQGLLSLSAGDAQTLLAFLDRVCS